MYKPSRALRTTAPLGVASITGGRGPQLLNKAATPAFTTRKRAKRPIKPPDENLAPIAFTYCFTNSDLLLQERDATCREASSIVFGSIIRAPHQVVEWRLDRAQHHFLQNLGALGVGGSAPA